MPEERKRFDARPFFKPENVILDIQDMSMEKLYETFARLLLRQINADKEEFVREIAEQCLIRENIATLAIGLGVAYIHPEQTSDKLLPYITESMVAIGISREGIRWYSEKEPDTDRSMDHELVHIIYFSITLRKEYLKVIARFSKIVKDKETRDRLIAAETPEEVIAIVKVALLKSYPV